MKEGEEKTPVNEAIEAAFPLKKLEKLTKALTIGGTMRNREPIMALVKKITSQEGFEPLIKTAIGSIDVEVWTPEGVQEILHGSTFYFGDFLLLGEEQLNQALEQRPDLYSYDISRRAFNEAMMSASILMGTVTLPHDLDKKNIARIVMYHCLQNIIYHNPLDEVGSDGAPILLYGCLKTMTNRLTHSEDIL
jgi:hypothetical protein